MIRKLFIVGVTLICAFRSFGEDAQESPPRAGKELAVQEANHKEGFKLSEKAKQVIGLKLKPIGSSPYSVPKEALVYYGDKIGIYRVREGWFKLIEVRRLKNKGVEIVQSNELVNSDQIAVDGVALLRVSELDAFGGGE